MSKSGKEGVGGAPRARGRAYRVRGAISPISRALMGFCCLALIGAVWWGVTRGGAEDRIVSPSILGSPAEVFGSFGSLWFDRALMRNTLASLWRVAQGYGLALLLGVPLGILAGCFPRFNAFLSPITLFGRNVPIAALLPLSLMWFGTGEAQKSMFIFIAAVSFVVVDATQTVVSVDQKYVDTAYTLGASRAQIILKVLVPLAAPDIFTSARLLFGLGFGYIVLAEMVGLEGGGIGALISISMRRGPREHVYLSLVWLALFAYGVDRVLFFAGTWLFPHRYRRS